MKPFTLVIVFCDWLAPQHGKCIPEIPYFNKIDE